MTHDEEKVVATLAVLDKSFASLPKQKAGGDPMLDMAESLLPRPIWVEAPWSRDNPQYKSVPWLNNRRSEIAASIQKQLRELQLLRDEDKTMFQLQRAARYHWTTSGGETWNYKLESQAKTHAAEIEAIKKSAKSEAE